MKPGMRTVFRVMEHLLLAAAVVGAGLLLTAGLWLQSGDFPTQADAMVVLGGNFNRPAYAAQLYQLGMGRKIYVGRPAPWSGEKVLEENGIDFPRRENLYMDILTKKGVPYEAVTLFGEDLDSTMSEAEGLSRLLTGTSGTLMVIAAPYQARRVRVAFAKALPDWSIRVVGDPAERIRTAWWSDRTSAKAVLMEIPKTAFYMLGGRCEPSQPGQ